MYVLRHHVTTRFETPAAGEGNFLYPRYHFFSTEQHQFPLIVSSYYGDRVNKNEVTVCNAKIHRRNTQAETGTESNVFLGFNFNISYLFLVFQVVYNKPSAPTFSFGVRHSDYITVTVSEHVA